jgi:hypothetical protein
VVQPGRLRKKAMHGTQAQTQRRYWIGATIDWLMTRPGRQVTGAVLLLVAGQLAFAAFEKFALGLPVIREAPAGFAPYQLGQTLFVALAAFWLVTALVGARAPDCAMATEPCGRAPRNAAVGLFAVAAAMILVFLRDPAAFHVGAQEDQPLEWLSAWLLFAGAGLFLLHAVRGRLDRVTLLAAAGLGLLLFVIGMEEISWGQRLFGFATPEGLAEANWQHEFNLHNVQTDLSETLYYVGASLFLILLPLLRDLVPAGFRSLPVDRLAPHRHVALASAPVFVFNYGDWNLYSIQLASMLAVGAYLAWAVAAARRGDRAEAIAFMLAALLVVAGQALFLARGATLVDIPDPTEYKEFFIALAFAWYGATVRPALAP